MTSASNHLMQPAGRRVRLIPIVNSVNQRLLWFRVCLEEVPNNIVGCYTSTGIEARVIRQLARNIHWRVVPVVLPSHQTKEPHFGVAAQRGGFLLCNCRDIALRIAQGKSAVEGRTFIGCGGSPVVKCLLLRSHVRIAGPAGSATIGDLGILIPVKNQYGNGS